MRLWSCVTMGVSLGVEFLDEKGDFKAEVVGVRDHATEAVELTGEDVAFAGFVDIGRCS